MPLATIEEMMCHKQVYSTWAKALRCIKTIRRYRSEVLHPYRCLVCQRIHIGHPNQQFEKGQPQHRGCYQPPSREKLIAGAAKVRALLARP